MAEEQQNNKREVENLTISELVKKCLDAEGYVIFVGSLSSKTDELGNRMIDFNYRRYHFSYEDVKTTIQKFKEAFINDVTDSIDDRDNN